MAEKKENKKQSKQSFFQKHFYLFTELFGFMKTEKKWWLLPTIILLLLVGVIIIVAESSVLSPFIYALF